MVAMAIGHLLMVAMLMSLVGLAPKGKAKAKDAKKKGRDEEDDDDGVSKNDQVNFVNSLSRGEKEGDKKDCLAIYQSLSRFDPMKKQLIAAWKMDKSCKWVGSYRQICKSTKATSCETSSGFGTM